MYANGKKYMRKLWILLFFLVAADALEAQLQSGTVAPDFTATDLNGQSWRLYDLLEQGKIVVLEISATWCAPCWAYHNGHAMHHFYEAHGPDGDDKARVLFVEGDPKTNVNCLYGSAGCNSYTPGNWVDGTPFPIINDDSIAKAYKVEYFPTIFVICPNKKAYEVGQWNADDLWEQATTCPVAFGVNNAGIFNYSSGTDLHEVCGGLDVTPGFSLINLGSKALTEATVALRWNNATVQQIEWTGQLSRYEETNIQFDALALDQPGNLSTQLISVNYAPTDDEESNNIHTDSFSVARAFNNLKVLLKIRTDQYGAETYWELRNEQGEVLESGGNQHVGPLGGGMFTGISGGPGAYKNNTIVRDTLNLPAPGCYSIHFVDYYGDGMCCDYGNGYYKLYDIDNLNVPIMFGGEFRAYDNRAFSAGLLTATSEPLPVLSVLLYPNPADQQVSLRFTLPEKAAVSTLILNALGQVVSASAANIFPAGEHQTGIGIGHLPEGVYWLQLQVDGNPVVRKFMIQRR